MYRFNLMITAHVITKAEDTKRRIEEHVAGETFPLEFRFRSAKRHYPADMPVELKAQHGGFPQDWSGYRIWKRWKTGQVHTIELPNAGKGPWEYQWLAVGEHGSKVVVPCEGKVPKVQGRPLPSSKRDRIEYLWAVVGQRTEKDSPPYSQIMLTHKPEVQLCIDKEFSFYRG